MQTALVYPVPSVAAVSLAPQVPAKVSMMQAALVTVFEVGTGVTTPELLPITFTTAECEAPVSGAIELAFIVDISGEPRNITFVHPLGNDLDSLALNTLAAERFKPGQSNSSPVAVAESIAMKLDACPVHVGTGSKTGATYLRVHSQPKQHLGPTDVFPGEVTYSNAMRSDHNGGVFRPGPDVSSPVMLLASPIIEMGSGTRAKYQGEVRLTLIVDSFGMPQNIRVSRPLGMGLDQKAIDAMRKARFKPAVHRGKQPVPVMITVAVSFRIC